jgi:hypothetical protein
MPRIAVCHNLGPRNAWAIVALAGGCWSRRKVSNWIDSGGNGPQLCTDDDDWENSRRRRKRRLRTHLTFVTFGLAALLLALASNSLYARDPDGRYANSPLKQWFDSLKSGKGPCCSDADGTAVSDVDWESANGHYRVRLDGEWIDVPDEAVITEPNRVGRTMVWPLRGYLGVSIRCFMPGSMT